MRSRHRRSLWRARRSRSLPQERARAALARLAAAGAARAVVRVRSRYDAAVASPSELSLQKLFERRRSAASAHAQRDRRIIQRRCRRLLGRRRWRRRLQLRWVLLPRSGRTRRRQGRRRRPRVGVALVAALAVTQRPPAVVAAAVAGRTPTRPRLPLRLRRHPRLLLLLRLLRRVLVVQLAPVRIVAAVKAAAAL